MRGSILAAVLLTAASFLVCQAEPSARAQGEPKASPEASGAVSPTTKGKRVGPHELIEEPELRGAWRAEAYILKDGTRHAVQGHIFFTEKDWTVLFFVVDDKGPARGSAEGGTYALDGQKLVFTHLYHLAAGKAMAGLPESPLRMEIRSKDSALTEPCTIAFDGNRLRIDFPSGNAMTFLRSSNP